MKLRQSGGLVIYRHHNGKPRTGAARRAAVPRTCHIMSPLGGVLFSRHCFPGIPAPTLTSATSFGGQGAALEAHRGAIITHGRSDVVSRWSTPARRGSARPAGGAK